ncbi:hypothetical protein [Azospirillum sp. TSO35-2]|uniref:hypothetical protein n=1 Tax=Azospirillum sp. TSO35-2 TaxID=716796 RepID=UPI000D617A23|nr:hypothetical protein [Azospirillum sp. TSO35-2]PWC32966.1 hypothetical protein TSO352_20545 [Azospirillum sp. TSO35-2]
MKDIIAATTGWGVHAVACTGLRDAAPASWVASLRNALSDAGAGRTLFLDLREVGDAPLPAFHLGALASVLVLAEHSAVLVSDLRHGHALCDAVRRAGTAAPGLRILPSTGRDRVAIAAAYQWLLNGREPADALSATASATVVPFPVAGRTSPAKLVPPTGLRHAS